MSTSYLLKQLLSPNVTRGHGHTLQDTHTLQQFEDAIWAVAVRLLPTHLSIYSRKRRRFVFSATCVLSDAVLLVIVLLNGGDLGESVRPL